MGWSAVSRCAEESEPLRPVAAQLEEIVEVSKTFGLELTDDVRERVLAGNRSDRYERAFDSELLRRQTETLIDCRSIETALLIG